MGMEIIKSYKTFRFKTRDNYEKYALSPIIKKKIATYFYLPGPFSSLIWFEYIQWFALKKFD